MKANEVRFEEYRSRTPSCVVVGYGIVSRIVYVGRRPAPARGLKVGLLPADHALAVPDERDRAAGRRASSASSRRAVSTGQMVEDVRLAVERPLPGGFYGRCGGMVPDGQEILERTRRSSRPRRRSRPEVGTDGEGLREASRPSTTSSSASAGSQKTTHYCPGCGHGHVHKYIAEALHDFGLAGPRDRRSAPSAARSSPTTTSTPATCRWRTAARRRWPPASSAPTRTPSSSATRATATWRRSAATRSSRRPTAARTITVFFINNAIYGMTGGQMAPTTLLGHEDHDQPARARPGRGLPDPRLRAAQQPDRAVLHRAGRARRQREQPQGARRGAQGAADTRSRTRASRSSRSSRPARPAGRCSRSPPRSGRSRRCRRSSRSASSATAARSSATRWHRAQVRAGRSSRSSAGTADENAAGLLEECGRRSRGARKIAGSAARACC